MTIDYLIVGQGVAGSVLAWTLDQRGCSVLLADSPALPSASGAAAGIVNPLTGRKLVRTWQADKLFPFLHDFYTDIEQQLDVRFFQPKNIYRPFRSATERSDYLALLDDPETGKYAHETFDNQLYSGCIHNEFGGLTVTQSGWVDLTEFVRIIKGYFIKKNQYYEGEISTNELLIRQDDCIWKGLTIKKIIFCDGVQGRENPLFDWLPYNPVKGQILTATIANYPIKSIVNQGVFILPLRPGLIRIGATYTWHDLDWQISDEGRLFLERKVASVLRLPYTVVAQQAGIRPSTKDRRPFVGLHPAHKSVGIFGGMGSKGASLTPFLAAQLAGHLLDGENLDPATNISRYESLYFEKKN